MDQEVLLPRLYQKKPLTRKIVPMRYSPFVDRYLTAKRYQAYNSVPVWNMRYTSRSIERERETDSKFVFFKNLVTEAEKNTSVRERKFAEYSDKVRKDIQ